MEIPMILIPTINDETAMIALINVVMTTKFTASSGVWMKAKIAIIDSSLVIIEMTLRMASFCLATRIQVESNALATRINSEENIEVL